MAGSDLFGRGGFAQRLAQTLLMFRADTSDLEAKLKTVQGEEKKAVQASIDATKQRNDEYESWAKNLTMINTGAIVLTKGIQVAADAWKDYEQWAKKAGGADAERASQFRKSLDDWGKSIDQVKLKMGQWVTTLGPAINQLTTLVNLSAQMITLAGGDWVSSMAKKLGISDANADRLQTLADSNPITHPINFATNVLGGTEDIVGIGQYGLGGSSAQQQAYFDAWHKKNGYALDLGIGDVSFPASGNDALVADYYVRPPKKPPKKKRARGGGGDNEPLFYVQGEDGGDLVAVYNWGGYDSSLAARPKRGSPSAGSFSGILGAGGGDYSTLPSLSVPVESSAQYTQALMKSIGLDPHSVYALEQAGNKQFASARESYLATLFGPIEEFQAYQKAFAVLTSAVGDAYTAMVTGSESAGKAIKDAIAQGLLGLGKEAAVRSITELAYGVASLAIGGPFAGASAAAHFQAAALFGAGAVAAGVAAHELGAGGAGASAGGASAGRAPSVIGNGGAVQRPPEQIVVYYGDFFADNNPRHQRQNIGTAVRNSRLAAQGAVGVRDA